MKTLTTIQGLGFIAYNIYYVSWDDEIYIPVTIKINEKLRKLLEKLMEGMEITGRFRLQTVQH